MKPLQMQEVYKVGKQYTDISLEEAPPDEIEISAVEGEIYNHLDGLFEILRLDTHIFDKQNVIDKLNAFVSLVNEQQGVK